MIPFIEDYYQSIRYKSVEASCLVPDSHCFSRSLEGRGFHLRFTEPFPWWSDRKKKRFSENNAQKLIGNELIEFDSAYSKLGAMLWWDISSLANVVSLYYQEHGFELVREGYLHELRCPHDDKSRPPCCEFVELGFKRAKRRGAKPKSSSQRVSKNQPAWTSNPFGLSLGEGSK